MSLKLWYTFGFIFWPVTVQLRLIRGRNLSLKLLTWLPKSCLLLLHLVKVCYYLKSQRKKNLFIECGVLFNILSSFFAVDQVQLNRAKESTKSAVLMNLESRVVFLFKIILFYCFTCLFVYSFSVLFFLQMVASEDIGRQILTYGERYALMVKR